MALKSGFWNASGGDRLFDAEDVNLFFDGFATDGVLSMIGDSFIVQAHGGLTLSVGTGKMWFLKKWVYNTTEKLVSVTTPDIVLPRIDTVVMEIDARDSGRSAQLYILEGLLYESNPVPRTLDSSENFIQVPLADIYVGAGVTEITAENITNRVGTADCPFATGILDQLNASELLDQMWADYLLWKDSVIDDILAIDNESILTYLQQVREAEELVVGRNLVINGDMLINQHAMNGNSAQNITSADFPEDQYKKVADRWRIWSQGASGTWTLSRIDYGNNVYGLRATVTSTAALTGSLSGFNIGQNIEASRLQQLKKGSTDAKPLHLSWKVKTNVVGLQYGVELYDPINNRHFSAGASNYIGPDFTEDSMVIPADYTGSLVNANTTGLELRFWLCAGSGLTSGTPATNWAAYSPNNTAPGIDNLADTVANYIEFTDVQLEIGSIGTPFERLSYDDALRLCQRYTEMRATYRNFGIGSTSGDWVTVLDMAYVVPKADLIETIEAETIWVIDGGSATTGASYVCETPEVIPVPPFTSTRPQQERLDFRVHSPFFGIQASKMYIVQVKNLFVDAELMSSGI